MRIYDKLLQFLPIVISFLILCFSYVVDRYGGKVLFGALKGFVEKKEGESEEAVREKRLKLTESFSAYSFSLSYLMSIVTAQISFLGTSFALKTDKIGVVSLWFVIVLLIAFVCVFFLLLLTFVLDPLGFPTRRTRRIGIKYITLANIFLISSYLFYGVILYYSTEW